MHSLLVTMPTGANVDSLFIKGFSDTADYANRGAQLANDILANQNAPVKDAWLTPTQVINGFVSVGNAFPDGANVIISKDVSLAAAQFHAKFETWIDAKK